MFPQNRIGEEMRKKRKKERIETAIFFIGVAIVWLVLTLIFGGREQLVSPEQELYWSNPK